MDIKIIKKYKFTGGDAVSHYDAHFETNPTMEEFFEWIIKENPEDWGVVENPELWPDNYMEYSDGEIVRVCDNYNEINNHFLVKGNFFHLFFLIYVHQIQHL